MFKVHVDYIFLKKLYLYIYIWPLLPFLIMACTLYTSQYRSKSKEMNTCKYYLAKQESSIRLYSFRRN